MGKFVFTILLFLHPISLWSNKPVGFAVVLDLKPHWKTSNDAAHIYLPYQVSRSDAHIQFDLDLNRYKNHRLYLVLPPKHFLWFDHQLLLSTNRTENETFSIDSLYTRYSTHKLRVTIYSEKLAPQQIETLIIDTKGVNQSQSSPIYEYKRARNQSINLFIITSLLVFAIMVLVRFFYFEMFNEYFSIRLFQPKHRFERESYGLFDGENFIFLMLYGVMCTAAAVNILLFNKVAHSVSLTSASSEALVNGIKIGGIFIAIVLAKYFVVALLSALFQLKKLKAQHFFMFLRYLLLVAWLFFFISLLNGVFKGDLIPKYLSWIISGLLITYVVYLVVVFLNLNKTYTFRKVLLFSYLCGSELVPFVLLFKSCLKIVSFT